MMIILGSLESA